MNSQHNAQQTAEAIFKALELQPSAEQSSEAIRLIEGAIIEAYRDSAKQCSDVAVQSLGPDSDMAHKLADEIRRKNLLLIANLSSMQ